MNSSEFSLAFVDPGGDPEKLLFFLIPVCIANLAYFLFHKRFRAIMVAYRERMATGNPGLEKRMNAVILTRTETALELVSSSLSLSKIQTSISLSELPLFSSFYPLSYSGASEALLLFYNNGKTEAKSSMTTKCFHRIQETSELLLRYVFTRGIHRLYGACMCNSLLRCLNPLSRHKSDLVPQ